MEKWQNAEDPADDQDEESLDETRWSWRTAAVSLGVLAAVIAALIIFWPQPTTPGQSSAKPSVQAPGTDDGASSAPPQIPGADLLTGSWPSQTAKALKRDLGVTQVSRILLTSTQAQATGAVPGDADKWSDLLYVEDKAINAGAALIAPEPSDLFDLNDVALTEVPRLVASAQAAASPPITETLVLIARDSVTAGAPVQIQVFVTGDGKRSLLTAAASGAVLKN